MQLLSLGTVLVLMLVLSLVEMVVPLRPRGSSRRVAANLGLSAVTVALNLGLSAVVVLAAGASHERGLGLLTGMGPWVQIVIGVVVLDLATYVAHRVMHRVPALWSVHRVHHADPLVDVTTAYRQHPMEGMVRFAFLLVPAVVLGLPPTALAVYRLVSAVNGLFEHANVKLWAPLDRLLSWFVVTPNMHKIHHSRKQPETDSNYGNILSAYDRVFGTFTPYDRAEPVAYGLDDHDAVDRERLGRLLTMPFARSPLRGPTP